MGLLFPLAMLLVIGVTRSPIPPFYKSREKRSVRAIHSNVVLRPRGPDAMPRLAARDAAAVAVILDDGYGGKSATVPPTFSLAFCIEMCLSRPTELR